MVDADLAGHDRVEVALLPAAFVVAMVAIKTFLALIRRLDFIPFAIYRFLLAFVVYLVFVA